MRVIKSKAATITLMLALFASSIGAIGLGNKNCEAKWEGSIDAEMLQQVRSDLDKASGCKVLRVDLLSPGGSVFHTLEIIHDLRKAEQAGLVVEIHGGAVVASGATFVLAAGSRGMRFVRGNSLALVHGIQSRSMFGQTCSEFVADPKTDEEKMINKLLVLMANEYAALSGKPVEETFKWLKCDNTQAGFGDLLVKLGLADHVEE